MTWYTTIGEIRAAFYPRISVLLDLEPDELVAIPPGWPGDTDSNRDKTPPDPRITASSEETAS